MIVAKFFYSWKRTNHKINDEKEKQLCERLNRMNLEELTEMVNEIPKTIQQDQKYIHFKCRASSLDKKDLFSSDPYFVIEKEIYSDRREQIFKSETIKKSLSPVWTEFELHLDVLCSGDLSKKLWFLVYDWDKLSNDDLIGQFSCTLEELMQGKKEYNVIEPTLAAKKKNYPNSGVFHFDTVQEIMRNVSIPNPEHQVYYNILKKKENSTEAFLDYIYGGTSISVSIGIDFTGSNGHYQSTSRFVF